MAHNVSGIAEVGAFENRQFKYSKKADRRTLVELLPSAPILAIPCSSDTFGEFCILLLTS
jgi:hypothetical protein